MEYQIKGLDVARWLPTATKEGSYQLLIGCLFDDGESEEDLAPLSAKSGLIYLSPNLDHMMQIYESRPHIFYVVRVK